MFTESAINESLRLSSASMNIRIVQEDFNLKLEGERSMAVRKGDVIALYPQSTHMDPEIYKDPEVIEWMAGMHAHNVGVGQNGCRLHIIAYIIAAPAAAPSTHNTYQCVHVCVYMFACVLPAIKAAFSQTSNNLE